MTQETVSLKVEQQSKSNTIGNNMNEEKLDRGLPCDSAVPLLCEHTKDMQPSCQRYLYPMFTTAITQEPRHGRNPQQVNR